MSFTQSSRSNSLCPHAEMRRDGKCDFIFVSGHDQQQDGCCSLLVTEDVSMEFKISYTKPQQYLRTTSERALEVTGGAREYNLTAGCWDKQAS
ncbi:hypothetical protein EmuJ_000795800 [Echinococcus multilocularis]|uniref:Uncharacterized protein n=1 Tax=Echinococcus multilocularis TaxID=6211 RepID=A0A068YDT3_ECHMU|nr:hypothetical protein EmuJ_000795800 [Echinococcus multilocularis]